MIEASRDNAVSPPARLQAASTVNPGGTFRGSCRNPRPVLVQTLGVYRCETRPAP